MNTPKRTQVLSVEVYVEPGTEPADRTLGYVIQALKSSCRNIRDGSVAIIIRNDQDDIVGLDLSGTPSETLQAEIGDLFDPDNIDDPVPLVKP